MVPIIEIKKFKKYYGDFKAVDMDYLSVHKGEILALLGPNGAGKTTTLEALEGLRRPTSGELFIKGKNVLTEYNKIRQILGVQLQSQNLPKTITVKEAMELFCSYYKVNPRYDLLERFKLKEFSNRAFCNLSLGQQRKLALSIAIAHNPEVLILDEPTAGLDVNVKAELHEVLRELKSNGTAIILSSHDLFEIEKLADRIAILMNGKIITVGTPEEIKNTYHKIKFRVKTNKGTLNSGFRSLFDNLKKLDQYTEFYIDNKDIHQVLSDIMTHMNNQGDEIVDINIDKSSLEDRFIALTNNREEL